MKKALLIALLLVFVIACFLPVNADDRGLVWVVPPAFEYEYIRYCGMCDVFWDTESSQLINRETAVLMEKYKAHHGGNRVRVLYDPERDLFGRAVSGESGGDIIVCPFNELAEQFPWATEQIISVYSVDSSMRVIPEYEGGWEWLEPDAYGKLAVMYRGKFVTGFIFDCEDNRGWNQIGWQNMIPMILDGSWGIIDSGGNAAAPFVFNHILTIDADTAFASYNGKYGILNVPLTTANGNFKPANPAAPATSDYACRLAALILVTAIIFNINKKIKLRRVLL